MAGLPVIKDSSVARVKRFAHHYPLLLTKFTPPRAPDFLLSRPRLLQRLDDAESASLTLVCGAAGSGKTTLLAQWYHQRQQQGDALAWLSFATNDNAPLLFARYILEALRPLYQGLNSTFPTRLDDESPADFSLFLTSLINQLHHCPHPLYLILDDYQNIRHPVIHQGMSYLLDHAPAALHLMISSRSRPALSLGRLQIQEQLVEIDDEALRFTLSEATAYCRDAIPTRHQWDIQRLVGTTEGWIAGMKIATLSSHQNPRTDQQVQHINLRSRTLTRYLEEVVFSPLPAEVFSFLTQTSILNRLSPMLCNAVTGKNNGADMLAWIEQHNLFLSALDESGSWFRYHPLMRDALFSRLQQSAQHNVHRLHERAGNWFASQQLWAEAIRHALAAGQPTPLHAEAGAQSLAEEGDIETMVRWTHYLPAEVDSSRIELQLNLAWALAHRFRFNDARQLLDAIERWVAEKRDNLNHSTWVKLRVVRGICEAFADNIPASIEIVEPLLQEIPCGDIWVDGLVCNILSYCHLAALRSQQALDIQRRIAGNPQENRNLFVRVYRTFVVAQGYLRQGDLQQAQRLTSQALQDAEPDIGANSSSGATLAPILAAIAWELGEVERIDELLGLRLQMIDDFSPPEGLSRSYIVLARQTMLKGQIDEANSLLVHAEQLATQRGWSGALAPLLAERVTLTIKQGEIDKAHDLFSRLQTLAEQSHGAKNRVISGYLCLSQSRLLLAKGQPQAAAKQLVRLVADQEQCGEWLSAVHCRLLLTKALWRAGEKEQAAVVCKPALERALQQNLLRSLLDVGPTLLLLLNHLRKQQGPHDEFTHVISQLWTMLPTTELGTQPGHADSSPLKLTEREQQILRLIAEGYPNKSIARALGISAETVKWHVKHLYEKLQVSNRTQAVNQARKWHLLND